MTQPPIFALHDELLENILEEVFLSCHGTELWPREYMYRFSRPMEDLAACTLVCRSWNAPATRYLFRNITYSFSYSTTDALLQLPPFGATHWVKPGFPTKTLADFAGFLRTHALATRSVRNLHLDAWNLLQSGTQHDITPAAFAAFLELFPGLRALRLTNLRFAPTALPVMVLDRRLDTLFVTTNNQGQCSLYHAQDVARVLACFGPVGSLEFGCFLRNGTDGWDHTAAAPPAATFLRTESLILDNRMRAVSWPSAQLLRYVVAQRDAVRSVRSLTIARQVEEHGCYGPLMDLLRQAQDNLEHLALHRGLLVRLPHTLRFTALRTLRLSFSLDCARPMDCCDIVNDVARLFALWAASPFARAPVTEIVLVAKLYRSWDLDQWAGWPEWPSENAVETLNDNRLDTTVLGFLKKFGASCRVKIVWSVGPLHNSVIGALQRAVEGPLYERIMAALCPRMNEWARESTSSL